MFVNFKLSKLKIKASVCLKLKENSVLQFSVSEFHLVQPSFTKHFFAAVKNWSTSCFHLLHCHSSNSRALTQFREPRKRPLPKVSFFLLFISVIHFVFQEELEVTFENQWIFDIH